jgi:hypothetical protein
MVQRRALLYLFATCATGDPLIPLSWNAERGLAVLDTATTGGGGGSGSGSSSGQVAAGSSNGGNEDAENDMSATSDRFSANVDSVGAIDAEWIEKMLAAASTQNRPPTYAPTSLFDDDDDQTGSYAPQLHMSPGMIVAISWSGALLTALILKGATMVWLWRDYGMKSVICGSKGDIDPSKEVQIVLCGDVSDVQPLRPSADSSTSSVAFTATAVGI